MNVERDLRAQIVRPADVDPQRFGALIDGTDLAVIRGERSPAVAFLFGQSLVQLDFGADLLLHDFEILLDLFDFRGLFLLRLSQLVNEILLVRFGLLLGFHELRPAAHRDGDGLVATSSAAVTFSVAVFSKAALTACKVAICSLAALASACTFSMLAYTASRASR